MKKSILLIASFILFAVQLSANSSLFYKVHKGSKNLGYYEINYKDSKHKIISKSYGAANKIKFFVDKKIDFIQDGDKNIIFVKNKQRVEFNSKTKKSVLSKKLLKKYKRKIRKVKGDDMLLLTKKGKNSIELFNKRKINLLTLDEVLKFAVDGKVQEKNIILFDKLGVMKMIAKIVPTSTGFDIINKSKDVKYIKVTVKNNIPVQVKSYISNWSLDIYGAGEFKLNKIALDDIKSKIKTILNDKLSKVKNLNLLDIKKLKVKRTSYIVDYTAQLDYPSSVDNKKRYCVKTLRKFSKKVSHTQYNDSNCIAILEKGLKKQEVIKPLEDDLIKKYPQLKYTKKIKVSKKGEIMYKVIEEIK